MPTLLTAIFYITKKETHCFNVSIRFQTPMCSYASLLATLYTY